ncbi:MAG: RDD family protein [Pseudomonadota bacterium]
MAKSRLPELSMKPPAFTLGGRGAAMTDNLADKALYADILWTRFIAHVIDSVILVFALAGAWLALAIANIVTFGLLSLPLVLAGTLVPLLYYSLFVASDRPSTPGMRLMNVHVLTWEGRRPTFPQALLRIVLYYASISLLSPLILLVVFFNDKRRTVHDLLSGTVVVRELSSTK